MGTADEVQVVRLLPGDLDVARELFEVLNEVFEAESQSLSDAYIERLLGRIEFWALAAVVEERVVGGVTAHALPMTQFEHTELFVYDLAVRPEVQRRGIARRLIQTLVSSAKDQGIEVVFVPADNDDDHAVAFYRSLGGRPTSVTMFDLGEG